MTYDTVFKNCFIFLTKFPKIKFIWSSFDLQLTFRFSKRALGACPVAQQYRFHLQCRRHRRCRSDLWVGKIPWRGTWQPTPVFLREKSHGQRSLAGHNPWSRKESDTTEAAEQSMAQQKGPRTQENCFILLSKKDIKLIRLIWYVKLLGKHCQWMINLFKFILHG